MKPKSILFVCKYNRFRSRIAEAYFNKINKNKNYKAESAGVIEGFMPLDKNQVRIAKEFGLSISGKPRAMSMDLLKRQNMIIVVANDVPKSLFSYKWYKNKVIKWGVRDVKEGADTKGARTSTKKIIKKVNSLVKQLEKKK